MYLALRVMESPGAAPAVGAAVNGLWTVPAGHPLELIRDRANGGRPIDGNEGFCPAAIRRLRTAVEPPCPDHRLRHTRAMPDAPRDIRKQRRGIGIQRMRTDRHAVAVAHIRGERAPMRAMRTRCGSHRPSPRRRLRAPFDLFTNS